jgi:hypothetical protein
MAVANTEVRKFFSNDTGAYQWTPGVGNVAGALIAMLDTVLVNGYNVKSISGVSVDSGLLATFTTSAPHGYLRLDVVNISGASPAAYNGDWRIYSVPTSTTFTVQLATNPGAMSGTVAVKKAPIPGWSKVFSGTNKAVYRSIDPSATGMYLRVEDTQTTFAMLRAYESMTDVDTGRYPFPSLVSYPPTPVYPGYSTFIKSNYSGYTGQWAVIGDSRALYIWSCSTNYNLTDINNVSQGTYFVGDFVPVIPSDPYGFMFSPQMDGNNSATAWSSLSHGFNSSWGNSWCPRNHARIPNPIRMYICSGPMDASQSRMGVYGFPLPNGPDNRIYVEMVKIIQSDNHLRGYMPGILAPQHAAPFPQLSMVANIDGYPGSEFIAMPHGYAAGVLGQMLVNITTSWRT